MFKFSWLRILVQIYCAVLISGCSGLPIDKATLILHDKAVCCSDFAQLSFQPLERNARTKFSLTESSPAMKFPEGKSFVAAFSLPNNTKKVAIQSVYEAYLPETSYVDPVIVVLNQSKEEIARNSNLNFHIDKHIIFSGLFEWHFAASIPITQNAAYLVIYANKQSSSVLSVTSDNGTNWPAPPSPIGTLAIIPR